MDLSSLVGTDDQNISGSALVGTDLTIGIEGGGSETVDLSSLVGTDDQTLTLAANSLSIEDGNSVDLSGYLDNTDDQNISGSALVGTDLTIGIEGGGSETVDLSSLVGTDDQNISGSALVGTDLTIGIEGGGSETVDLSSLVGTDDQTASEVNITDAGGNFTATDVEGALAELAAGSTDDQTLTLAANSLSIEDGNSVDLSGYLDNTDDQTLTLAANSLSIEDGNSVDLSGYLDNTDDQFDDEVPLRTPIDVDEGGEAAPTAETTVQEVINAIAPITSKAARVFYPPSIAIDASTNGTGFTVDLYAQYLAQFGSPVAFSPGAPNAVPTYGPTELYYYVTYADPAVFSGLSIDPNGVLTYNIIGQPADYNSLINVVFVVK
ncbi:hypothetical protein [Robiginitalea sediminis]|uniref:hypothetical protein n=1 Tax=Robiginitalea sediminis TaxID=1982593 RepID=UPI00117A9441|nr:hypothetical protein [Robiginitalea sediminis]